jgi:antitoxin ParD1/3/4
MATMNVSLPAPMKAWVEARSADGRYSNSSDYVRDLIRKDQERANAISEIQALIDKGLESGVPKPFDKKAFLARVQHQYDNAT